ncbi:MAG TPA: hypothetical protein VM264_12565, partial [Acidimicrobiales bacterium]|nr:hypothetical protein [Acidimicrobiales bacterium]
MRRRVLAVAFAATALLAPAVPVSADDDHPATYIPSPESRSQNLKLLAELPRAGSITGYRNSDLAFWGRLAYAGNYEGFRIIDISAPEAPVVVADVVLRAST